MHPHQFVPKSNTKRYVLIFIVLLFIILLSIPYTRSGVQNVFRSLGTPVVRLTNSIGSWFSTTNAFIRSKRTLAEENTVLKNQIRELSIQNKERLVLEAELTDLREIYNRTDVRNLTLAAIITKPPQSLYGTIVIDGGEEMGFVSGQTVYAYGSVPIGVIDSVSKRSATVQLFSAPNRETQVRLLPLREDVTLVGRGGGNFSVSLPQGVEVSENTTVVTKEVNPRIIATFIEVISDTRDPIQTLLFAAPVPISELSFVEVEV